MKQKGTRAVRKKIRSPAELEWRRQYGWRRYEENFWRAWSHPIALSPRAIASAVRQITSSTDSAPKGQPPSHSDLGAPQGPPASDLV